MLNGRTARDAFDDVGQLGDPIALAGVRLVHQENPIDREPDVEKVEDETKNDAQKLRQHRYKHAQDHIDRKPRDRKSYRLARMEADERVLVVRLDVEKYQAGDKAQ